MSAPWFKFYPSDWRADPALRMCSIGARGLWMEMLCVMHEANPRGALMVNGNPVTERQLAGLTGCALKEVLSLLEELEAAGVFSRDNGVIFSRRMRRDDEKAERDKANGRSGGNPSLKRGVNPKDKAQKPEARDQISDADASETSASAPAPADDDDWPRDYRDRFWSKYPHRVGRSDALAKLDRVRKSRRVTFAKLMSGLDAYIAAKPPDRQWCNPATWLNQGRWDDEPSFDASRQSAGQPGRGPSRSERGRAIMAEILAGRPDSRLSASSAGPCRVDAGPADVRGEPSGPAGAPPDSGLFR